MIKLARKTPKAVNAVSYMKKSEFFAKKQQFAVYVSEYKCGILYEYGKKSA